MLVVLVLECRMDREAEKKVRAVGGVAFDDRAPANEDGL